METLWIRQGVLAPTIATALALALGCGTPEPKQANDYEDNTIPRPSHTAAIPAAVDPFDSPASSSTAPTASTGGTTAPDTSPLPQRAGPGWDREATQQQLDRAARQVKANCGSATDAEGKANGPWGQTKASIKLGHNGHSRDVSVSGEYANTPVGNCIVRGFNNLQFPPWQGPDVVVDWDVEVVKPK